MVGRVTGNKIFILFGLRDLEKQLGERSHLPLTEINCLNPVAKLVATYETGYKMMSNE